MTKSPISQDESCDTLLYLAEVALDDRIRGKWHVGKLWHCSRAIEIRIFVFGCLHCQICPRYLTKTDIWQGKSILDKRCVLWKRSRSRNCEPAKIFQAVLSRDKISDTWAAGKKVPVLEDFLHGQKSKSTQKTGSSRTIFTRRNSRNHAKRENIHQVRRTSKT